MSIYFDKLLPLFTQISASGKALKSDLECIQNLLEVDPGSAVLFAMDFCIDQDILIDPATFQEVEQFCEPCYSLHDDFIEFKEHQEGLRASS